MWSFPGHPILFSCKSRTYGLAFIKHNLNNSKVNKICKISVLIMPLHTKVSTIIIHANMSILPGAMVLGPVNRLLVWRPLFRRKRWKLIRPIYEICMISTSSPLVIVCFLDQNYRYKSVITQIPHGVRLAVLAESSSLTGDRTSATSRSKCSKQYALNRVTTELRHILYWFTLLYLLHCTEAKYCTKRSVITQVLWNLVQRRFDRWWGRIFGQYIGSVSRHLEYFG